MYLAQIYKESCTHISAFTTAVIDVDTYFQVNIFLIKEIVDCT